MVPPQPTAREKIAAVIAAIGGEIRRPVAAR
jgi:hypothetical protein